MSDFEIKCGNTLDIYTNNDDDPALVTVTVHKEAMYSLSQRQIAAASAPCSGKSSISSRVGEPGSESAAKGLLLTIANRSLGSIFPCPGMVRSSSLISAAFSLAGRIRTEPSPQSLQADRSFQ